MAKGISIESNMDDFMDQLNQEVNQIDDQVTAALSYAGKSVVNAARMVNTYTDQTGNLRHSIGYAIVDNGAVTETDVQAISAGDYTDKQGNVVHRPGSEAQKAVEGNAQQMVGKKGLVVVAGMPYASHVEQRGYDVITGSALKIEDYFKEGME